MANPLPTSLSRAGVLGAGAFAAANAPVLTAAVFGVGLTLVTILALTGVLAGRKARRDAAYKVLTLLLACPTVPPKGSSAKPGIAGCGCAFPN